MRSFSHLLLCSFFITSFFCSIVYSSDKDVFWFHYRNGQELLEKGDTLNAYIEFSTAYDYADDNQTKSKVKVILGDILFGWGDTYGAELMYTEAYRLDKKNISALKKIVIAKAENLADNFYDFFKLLPKDQIDSEVLFYYGKYILRKEKKPREACDIFDSVRRESPYFPKASYLCGVAMLMIGDRDEAVRRFENTYRFARDRFIKDYATLALARIYSDTGRFQDALPYYLSVTKDSPMFYEAKYEVCWVFFALERYDEVSKCVEYFKTVKKSYLTKRIEILEAFLYMNVDLARSYMIFSSISDYSEAFLSKIIETQDFPPIFWKKSSIRYFSSVEPDIVSWLDFIPEYKFYKERKEYIISLQKEIEEVIAQIEKLKGVSVVVADKTVKRYFKRLYDIQERIHNIFSLLVLSNADPEEKNLLFNLYSFFEELKNMDFKSRELAAISAMNSYKIATEKEFKNWEKKYEAYKKLLQLVMAELDKVADLYKKNSNYINQMILKIYSESNRPNDILEDFISLYSETNKLFFDYSEVWKEIIYTVIKYVEIQEKKLKAAKLVLDNFLDYLKEFEGRLLKYVFMSRIREEVEKTYALARYGFIEVAWVMKERESEILDEFHKVRIEEENKIRDLFSEYSKEVKNMDVPEASGKGESIFELEISEDINYLDNIDRTLGKTLQVMLKVSSTSWKEPEKTIQEIIEKKERERMKLLEKFKFIKQKAK